MDSASEEPIATFRSKWGSAGTLTFVEGQTFHLECKGWWRPVWTVTKQNGEPVLLLHAREKTVELAAGGAVVPASRVSQLIMFCWYRVLQAEEDAASTAAVATITAG